MSIDCKQLIYHPTRKEVITPVDQCLIKWCLATDTPEILDTLPLSFSLGTIPSTVLVESMDAIAIAPPTTIEAQTLELRHWQDGQLITKIPLNHQAYEEDFSKDDEFCGHQRCCALSALAVSGNGRYLAALEPWGDLHLIDLTRDLQSPHITRWQRRWDDYSSEIAFDTQFQFVIWNRIIEDESFNLFRIDDAEADRLSYFGYFDGGIRCHRGALSFSPFSDAIVHTDYFRQSRITYRSFNRAALLTRDGLSEEDSNELWDTPPAKVDWHRELPLIRHPHDESNPWQTSVAFVDSQRLIWAAGEALVLLNLEDGSIAGDFHTQSIIQDLAFDRERQRMIIATKNGLNTVYLSQFDPEASYVKTCQHVAASAGQ